MSAASTLATHPAGPRAQRQRWLSAATLAALGLLAVHRRHRGRPGRLHLDPGERSRVGESAAEGVTIASYR